MLVATVLVLIEICGFCIVLLRLLGYKATRVRTHLGSETARCQVKGTLVGVSVLMDFVLGLL